MSEVTINGMKSHTLSASNSTCTSGTSSASEPQLEVEGADPSTCKHEWWELRNTIPSKMKCRLCGAVSWGSVVAYQQPQWERVR